MTKQYYLPYKYLPKECVTLIDVTDFIDRSSAPTKEAVLFEVELDKIYLENVLRVTDDADEINVLLEYLSRTINVGKFIDKYGYRKAA